MRRPLAYDAISTTSLQNAGIGVVVFVPGADMPLMTANQIKMISAYCRCVRSTVGARARSGAFRSVRKRLYFP